MLGEAGAGKTVLAKTLARLEKPDSGRILVMGRDVARLSGRALRAVRRQVQYVYPDPRLALDSRQTVRQLLEEPLRLPGGQGSRPRPDEARLERVCARLQINPTLFRERPPALSTAMLERVSIARALVLRPAVLICDGLGELLEREALRSLLDDLAALAPMALYEPAPVLAGGTGAARGEAFALIWSARRPEKARGLAERALVLYRGRAVEVGPPGALLENPQHPYTRCWLGRPLPGEVHPRPYQQGCRYHPECPAALEACRREAPDLRAAAAPSARAGHRVACHLYPTDAGGAGIVAEAQGDRRFA